jgi:hypothetical protein
MEGRRDTGAGRLGGTSHRSDIIDRSLIIRARILLQGVIKSIKVPIGGAADANNIRSNLAPEGTSQLDS